MALEIFWARCSCCRLAIVALSGGGWNWRRPVVCPSHLPSLRPLVLQVSFACSNFVTPMMQSGSAGGFGLVWFGLGGVAGRRGDGTRYKTRQTVMVLIFHLLFVGNLVLNLR